ncbi:hypothetical protein OMP38_07695 [Cohnella ginsengisoli]|uniref:Uncharacterized protein n=1 Tax=Cohnella ginsengisoli TaxID=425004 RepID=A0A9X4KEW5_9BACL|nr:hypothetical protein [Cohnella ginsengisoli]MDG0790753.1 hypothetical protein [Cohnella ginsengisoli]
MEKKASIRKIPVQYPLGTKQISGFVLLFLLSLGNVIHGAEHFFLYVQAALMTLSGGCLAYLLIRRKVLKAELTLAGSRLTVNGLTITGDSLRELRINRGLVGLLPRGKKVVPVRLCLDLKDRSAGLLLLRWAEKQGVPVRQGSFMRWL